MTFIKLVVTIRREIEGYIYPGPPQFFIEKKLRGRKMKIYSFSQKVFVLEAISGPESRYSCAKLTLHEYVIGKDVLIHLNLPLY
jgi:hypothetical protein